MRYLFIIVLALAVVSGGSAVAATPAHHQTKAQVKVKTLTASNKTLTAKVKALSKQLADTTAALATEQRINLGLVTTLGQTPAPIAPPTDPSAPVPPPSGNATADDIWNFVVANFPRFPVIPESEIDTTCGYDRLDNSDPKNGYWEYDFIIEPC